MKSSRFARRLLRRKFAISLFAVAACGAAVPIQAAPDLTGKRFSIDWKNPDGSHNRTIEIAFDRGAPGQPVSATLLNPTQQDVESYSDRPTFTGRYSTGGRLDMKLTHPESRVKGFLMELDVTRGYALSGRWMLAIGPSFGSDPAPATGKCLNCGRSQSNWSRAAIFTALASFLLWAVYKGKTPAPAPPAGQGKGVVEDPKDPWNDLKRVLKKRSGQ